LKNFNIGNLFKIILNIHLIQKCQHYLFAIIKPGHSYTQAFHPAIYFDKTGIFRGNLIKIILVYKLFQRFILFKMAFGFDSRVPKTPKQWNICKQINFNFSSKLILFFYKSFLQKLMSFPTTICFSNCFYQFSVHKRIYLIIFIFNLMI
jgi:hypothetical protein